MKLVRQVLQETSFIKKKRITVFLIFLYGLTIFSQNVVTIFSFICKKRFYCFPKVLAFSYIFNIEVNKMTCFYYSKRSEQ